MKKTTILIIVVLFMVIGYAAYNTTINIYGNGKLAENLSDFKVYLSNLKVNGKEISGINNTKDEFIINDVNGTLEYEITNDSTEYDTENYLECETSKVWNYDYTGGEQNFVVPATGTYKLEAWGAQGGSLSTTYYGGYGGYSVGTIEVEKGKVIYINIGGKGKGNGTHTSQLGGYNGGGDAIGDTDGNTRQSSGGGLTHISLLSGLLKYMDLTGLHNLLLVAGGGAGSSANAAIMSTLGGSGGGYIGVSGEKYNESATINGMGYGGTQNISPLPQYGTGINKKYYSTGGFGYGANGIYAGGGGGFYGGSVSVTSSGGGSGYIDNSLLTAKSMYCYNCQESSEESTKTISTTCTSATPIANCAKQGDGYVRITYIGDKLLFQQGNGLILSKKSNTYKISINSKSLKCKLISKMVSKVSKTTSVFEYDYAGKEQIFTVPKTGTYKLEVWGAQGGNYNLLKLGGYGAYSVGNIELKKDEKLYVNIGGAGTGNGTHTTQIGGYNGGGNTMVDYDSHTIQSSGGGATHIAPKSGLLSTLENSKSDIYIVAGGGGGTSANFVVDETIGGSAGGYIGNFGEKYYQASTLYGIGYGGTQTSSPIPEFGSSLNKEYYSTGGFGYGANGIYVGGGGGFYGGSVSVASSGGGSGYIGNSLLTEKAMYCYNCQESKDISTKTISTTCTSATPTANCSKQGNGYARITLVSIK